MNKWKRELTQLAQSEGLSNVSIVETKNQHLRLEGLYKGKGIKILASMSPSDNRTLLHTRSYMRQSKRAIDSTG